MNCLTIKEFLDSSFSTMFKCSMVGDYLAIQTPFNYPDGDLIDVFLHERSGKILLSDLGETMRYINSYDFEIKNNPKRQTIVHDASTLHHVRFMKGIFYAHVESIDKLAEVIFNLTQCIIRVCDLLYTVRGSSPAAFVEEVKDYLDFNKFKFEENFSVETTSDNKYEFDLGVEVGNQIKLVKLMTPPSKPSHRPNIDRIVRIWFDLDLHSDYKKDARITLLDDGNYDWKNSILLLDKLSRVASWSAKDDFINALQSSVA